MYFRRLILIFGLILLLAGCNNAATDNGDALPSPQPAPTATAPNDESIVPPTLNLENSDKLTGELDEVTPTSVSIIVKGEIKQYPAKPKVKSDTEDLGIKKGDKVIINLVNEEAVSIEKIISE